MAPKITAQAAAMEGASLADVRPQPAKAALTARDDAPQLRDLAAEALRRTTSQKAAAIDIGVHEGRLSHKLRDGSLTLAQLEALGPDYLKHLSRTLHEQAPESPSAYVYRLLDQVTAIVHELRSFARLHE